MHDAPGPDPALTEALAALGFSSAPFASYTAGNEIEALKGA